MKIPDYLKSHLDTIKSLIEGVNTVNIGDLSHLVNQQIREILGRIESDPEISAGAIKLVEATSAVIANKVSEDSKQTAFSAICSFEDLLRAAKPNEVTKILRID